MLVAKRPPCEEKSLSLHNGSPAGLFICNAYYYVAVCSHPGRN